VLDDGKLPLDNTRAERALRKIVVGRKSWMFYGSDTHAEAAAAIFSVIASCRLHGLDPASSQRSLSGAVDALDLEGALSTGVAQAVRGRRLESSRRAQTMGDPRCAVGSIW
jgi:hypothetical protein